MPIKAVLFDIDGTITKGGANKTHMEAFKAAFREVYGVDASFDIAQTIGKTDRGILVETLTQAGLIREDVYAKMDSAFGFMGDYFSRNFKKEDLRLNPGVKGLIFALKKRGHVIGVLSGNVERIGWTKMEYAGLREEMDLGIFGESSEDRAELVKDGARRVKTIEPKIEMDDIYIIDDSLKGIEAGIKAGVKTIAMAVSKFSAEDFKKLHSTYIFKDFSDTAAMIDAIEKE
jgi:beta-phosphoglucomutase-like phosphatase (HAD superfamily)